MITVVGRQLQGLGDLADAQIQELQTQVRDATRAFNGKGYTAAQALPVLRTALQAAQANEQAAWSHVGYGVSGLPDQMYTDVRQNREQLEYLIAHLTAKGGNPYQYTVADKTWKDVRAAVIAPIVWQSGYVATMKVYAEADAMLAYELIENIKNLPAQVVGAVVAYVVDQAKQAVERAVEPLLPTGKAVPSWVFPTVVGSLALGVGLWAYGSLKKVTG